MPSAVIVGVGLVVALVVTSITFWPHGESAAGPADAGSARTDLSAPVPSTSRPLASVPPVSAPPTTSTSEPRSGWPVDLSSVELEAALLTEEDLLMTETVGAPPDTSDTVPVQDFAADVVCQEMLRRYDAIGFRPLFGGGLPRAPRRATVELTGRGGTIEHEVDDGLQVTVDDVADLFTTCTEITFPAHGRSVSVSIRDGASLPVGDDSLSLEYVVSDGMSEPTPVLWVLWERDSIISSVSISGGDARAQELLEDAVDIADLRLQDIIG